MANQIEYMIKHGELNVDQLIEFNSNLEDINRYINKNKQCVNSLRAEVKDFMYLLN